MHYFGTPWKAEYSSTVFFNMLRVHRELNVISHVYWFLFLVLHLQHKELKHMKL